MSRWVIHREKARLVHAAGNYAIDLRAIHDRADIRAALADLKREPFATDEVVNEAHSMLTNYLVWLQAQENAKYMRRL